jgi:hypothetical protein
MIEPLKYLLQPIAYERDDETGRVLREIPGQVITVYTANQAADAVMEFEAALKTLTQQTEEVTDASHRNGGASDQLRQPGLSRERA